MSTTPRPTSRSSSSHPSSSLSRPPSSSSLRPPSSASTSRPRSRTAGSTGPARPQSRFSQRTQSRLAKSRVNPFASVLVTQLTGLTDDNDPDAFKSAVDHVVKAVESTTLSKGAASVDMSQVEKRVNGLALKARIAMKDTVSEALLLAFGTLKTHVEEREKDLDSDIQTTHIPDHLQLLLSLSQPPSTSTVTSAEIFLDKIRNPKPSTPSLTWKDILAEEPFEGDHWQGILDPTTTSDDHDWDSTPSLSPLGSEPEDLDEPLSVLVYGRKRRTGRSFNRSLESSEEEEVPETAEKVLHGSNVPPHTYAHREEFEEMQAMQYWRREWKGFVPPSRQFNIGDPSTLGPALTEALAKEHGGLAATRALIHERYIREEDMVREVYMALQGRRNIVLEWKNSEYTTTSETPRLAHLSQIAQQAILSVLAQTATTLEHLRHFRSSVFTLSYSRTRSTVDSTKNEANLSKNITRTVEAFADAIDTEIRSFDMWCAEQEAAMCNTYTSNSKSPDVVVSLLHVSKALSNTFEHTFPVLFRILNEVFAPCLSSSSDFCLSYLTAGARAPAMVSSKLLDILFTSVQVHLERGETVTSGRLMRTFVKTAEPVWEMCGRWLRVGMGLVLSGGGRNVETDGLDEEFFIEEKIVRFVFGGEPFMGLLHPDFWREAYGLREGVVGGVSDEDHEDEDPPVNKQQQKAVPTFLEHVAEMILQTGKAVGLIRALDSNVDVFDNSGWESFEEFIVARNVEGNEGDAKKNLFSVSIDTLSRLIYDRLLPHCQEVGHALTKLLVDECGLWKHLEAIENLFLMRRGDAMSHFIDVVFNKMDNKQSWCDFHFLNTAFADVVEANVHVGAKDWIQPSLVRFSYRGGKEMEQTIHRTVKSIDGLSVEYAVPFPLTYMLRPSVVAVYNEVFLFLLQIRRAKGVLERILVRGGERKYVGTLGVKVLYAMRSRLSWFINTLLDFLTTFVIHAQVAQFHAKLKDAQSFDEMIFLHDNHLNKIQERCLLQKKTSTLHRAIISILDMSLRFSEFFTSLTGDTATHDISRHSLIRRHRSRRVARQRRDVIGFSQPSRGDDGLSSSDEDDDITDDFDDDGNQEPDVLKNLTMETESFSIMSTTGSPEEIAEELNKFSKELDELVRFVRRGMEGLVSGSGEAASAFGVLAFALEDWDV